MREFTSGNVRALFFALRFFLTLFSHTRGAFTGAVQGRIGRIEAAEGGTVFLDEIGEMPLALQSKLLRFVESGELQRAGENEPVKVECAFWPQPMSLSPNVRGRDVFAQTFTTVSLSFSSERPPWPSTPRI